MPSNSSEISMTLYRRLLGAEFASLSPALQQFHGNRFGGTARGTLEVVRCGGPIRNVVCSILRLPDAGHKVPVTVTVRVNGETEMWYRTFGDRTLVTRQWLEGGQLAEQSGPLIIKFAVYSDGAGMRFEFISCRLFGIQLPRMLAIWVEAQVIPTDTAWWVSVSIGGPFASRLLRYEGEVIPD